MSNPWDLPLSRPTPQQLFEDLYREAQSARYRTPTVHIACTMEWLDWFKRTHAGEEPGPLGGLGRLTGVGVYVTDDVTDPRGWEARPGTSPQQPSSSSKPPSSSWWRRLTDRSRGRG